jgi:transcriptional regulator with XRE-family HTH domain
MQHDLQKRVTDALRKHLTEKDLNQADLAKLNNTTRQTISNYFNGRTDLSLNTLESILASINIDLEVFLNELIGSYSNAYTLNEPMAEYGNVNTLKKEIDYLLKIEQTQKEHIDFLKNYIITFIDKFKYKKSANF